MATDATILITGAASGIGAALARLLAAPGVRLALHTRRNLDRLESVGAEARAKGAAIACIAADLAEADAPARIVAAATAGGTRLGALVANAGFADRTAIAALDDARFAASIDPIARGFLGLARAALPQLTDGGRIVAVSSFVAHAFRPGVPLFAASAAAKAAVEAMVKVLAIELAPRAITVNAVAPGFTRKDATAHAALEADRWKTIAETIPLRRIGEPAEVAAAIAFLLSPAAGYITGQCLHVDGGLCM
jgi:NAD(P)-dependent dehydrogenase (short-subunit alcohol dehydrogenase family)